MKTLITGGYGLVGSAFPEDDGINIIKVRNKNSKKDKNNLSQRCYNLRDPDQAKLMIKEHKPDQLIHLAARVGGILGNSEFVGDYFSDNSLINTNVLTQARNGGVKKVLSMLSTCIYPDQAPYPLTEKDLHNGVPHSSNFGYAFAKRMLEVQSRAYRIQYGLNYICAIPNNLYGEHDNFEEEYSHVVPALIRKFYEAKINNQNEVELWGTGEALRELTYAKDIAKISMLLLENYNDEEPINIGNIEEISIKDLAFLIKEEMEFDGKIIWNIDKPTGQLRKPSNNIKFAKLYSDFEYTDLKVGVQNTCNWFKDNYSKARGIKEKLEQEQIIKEKEQKREIKKLERKEKQGLRTFKNQIKENA